MSFMEWMLMPFLFVAVFIGIVLYLSLMLFPWPLALYYSIDMFDRLEQRIGFGWSCLVSAIGAGYLFTFSYLWTQWYITATDSIAAGFNGVPFLR